ncbi:MAG TPA: alpha/beta fold hydrolase [Rhodocyclaceae bacterium]|nr:alpha/beta fold hydrolase [Rhodocyclaceae bacterium]
MTQPIVLLHGWGYTPHVWDSFSHLLRREGVCTANLPPYAKSISDWADDLARSIPDGAVLVGWSLGAMLALEMASRHRHKINRLILMSATPRFVKGDDWPHGLDADTVQEFRTSFALDPLRTLERFVTLQTLGGNERHRISQMLNAALADSSEVSLQDGLQLLAESDVRRHVPVAGLPCLLIHGAQDMLMPLTAAQWVHERWTDCHLHVIPAAGHAPFVSHPELVASLIRNFVDAA